MVVCSNCRRAPLLVVLCRQERHTPHQASPDIHRKLHHWKRSRSSQTLLLGLASGAEPFAIWRERSA